jgi:hypothetical protein
MQTAVPLPDSMPRGKVNFRQGTRGWQAEILDIRLGPVFLLVPVDPIQENEEVNEGRGILFVSTGIENTAIGVLAVNPECFRD